jgi:flagellar hook-associated protein 2
MPSIISTGIGSGLDIAGIVQQLVAAEAQPVEARIGKQEARAQVKLSAYGSLKAALSEFQGALDAMRDVDQLLTRKAVSADEAVFLAVAGTSAVPASYSVEVVQKAQAQKLSSASFADSDTVVGTGSLSITVGAASFEVEITDDNDTLAGIRDAINDAADNQGIAATIVNADSGSHLILTSEKTGAANGITITQSGGDGGLAAIAYDPGNGQNALTELTAAQDAHIRIDGLEVYGESNSISGAIEGVSIDLVAAGAGQTVLLEVVNDEAAVSAKVDDFVTAYNELIAIFDKLTSYDADTRTAGPLLGDATARGIRDHIRRELSTAVSGIDAPFSTLSEVGIELALDGTLEIDEAALADTLGEDFADFGRLFAAGDGFAVRLSDVTQRYLDGDGALEARTAGLNAEIDDIADQRDRLGDRLVALEERLFRQFNALDSLLGQLSQTSSFLTQQLNALPGFTRPSGND